MPVLVPPATALLPAPFVGLVLLISLSITGSALAVLELALPAAC
ncbi:hypothetical protein [Actinoplanes aureus]|nr:hypothetical protein [Actinoplanes aureus]